MSDQARRVGSPTATGSPSVATVASGRLAPLPFGTKIGYSVGQVLDGVVSQSLGIFLFFYLTAVCGLPGGLAGIALAVGLAVDAVIDPLIGSATDGLRSRLGRRLPFMLVGLPAVAVLFVAIFSLPTGLSTTMLFVYVMVLSILLRIALSLFILPYQALGAELSDDYAERTSIMAWRWGLGVLGTTVAIILGFAVFFRGDGGTLNRAGYTPFALTFAALFLVTSLLSMRTIATTLDRQHPAVESEDGFHLRVWRELREVFENRSFRVLFASALLFFSALGTHSTLGLHVNTFFWHFTSGQTQTVTLATFVGLVLGAPLASPLMRRLEKRTVLLIGLIGLGLADTAPAALRLMGLFPFEGATLMWVLSGIVFVAGVLLAAAAIAFASMMADAADEHEHLFSARREGLYFAGWSFAGKAAAGVGALIAGTVIQLIHFPTDIVARGGAAAVLSPATVSWLGFFYGPGAGVLYLGAILATLGYRLNAEAHGRIMEDLRERRGVVLAEAAALKQ